MVSLRDYPEGAASYRQMGGCVSSTAQSIIDLTISLEGSEPLIWRRLYVPAQTALEELHEAIQSVIGWWDYHLHEFQVGDRRIGRPDYVDDFWDIDLPPLEDAREISIGELLDEGVRWFRYLYDFGDGWSMAVSMSRCITPVEPIKRICCVDGARSGPLEDSGGPGGFEEVCRAVADPDHEEHESYRRWVPRGFQPENFSAAGVDWILANRIIEENAPDHLMGWLGALPKGLTMTDPCYRELWWSLMRPEITNADQAREAARDVRETCASEPLHAWTDLTVGHYTALISAEPGILPPAVVLNESLSSEELAVVPHLANARTFLKMIDEGGNLRATAKGNLPRVFVHQFIGQMVASVEIRKAPRVVLQWNEEQIWPVHDLRLMLQKAGLLKLRKGRLSLTQRGRDLIQEGREGALMNRLFRAEIARTRTPRDIHGWEAAFDAGWGFMLHNWTNRQFRWQGPGALAEDMLPPYARERILLQEGEEAIPILFELLFLDMMEAFGLAESRKAPVSEDPGRRMRQYRPTPLAPRFLTFNLAHPDISIEETG